MATILGWVIPILLNWLVAFVEKEAQSLKDSHDTDVARDKTDSDNVKKYQDAQSRADKIRAAQDVLNRNST